MNRLSKRPMRGTAVRRIGEQPRCTNAVDGGLIALQTADSSVDKRVYLNMGLIIFIKRRSVIDKVKYEIWV